MDDIRRKAIKFEAEKYGVATNQFVDGFVNGYQQGEADGKVKTIDDCIAILLNIMPPEPFLVKSKHYENWKMKTTELRMLRDMFEQLKEQKNDSI